MEAQDDLSPPLGIAMASRSQRPGDMVVAARDEPELADYASLFPDLLMADMAAHHLSNSAIQGHGHLFLRRACWEAALIAYGRCFQQAGGRVADRGAPWTT